jgi:proteasome alpha subunit
MGGQTESVAQALKDGYEEGASLEVALRTAVRALEAQDSDRRLEAKSLEVAVLDRNREHRLFRRLPARRIEELLAAGDGGPAAGSSGSSGGSSAGPSVEDVDDVLGDGEG